MCPPCVLWCEFLSSGDSRYVLNDSPSGWKGEAARRAIGIEQYQHDPEDEYWGFTSWNDFFTRRLADGARPVASPDDDSVIVSACESTPYGLAVGVQRQDRFWIKSQPYSLQDMLANDESADQFVGGTVYQAFLSATNYHRWHSPVAGTIVRAFVMEGTYYSEPDSEGADAVEPQYSQSYLAHVAARAVIVIEADNPVIGLTAFVPVGMSEVSSCVIDPAIQPGYHVAKGEELGYFQFGGSTHCLVFRPGAIADFSLTAIPQPHPAPSPGASPLQARHRSVGVNRVTAPGKPACQPVVWRPCWSGLMDHSAWARPRPLLSCAGGCPAVPCATRDMSASGGASCCRPPCAATSRTFRPGGTRCGSCSAGLWRNTTARSSSL